MASIVKMSITVIETFERKEVWKIYKNTIKDIRVLYYKNTYRWIKTLQHCKDLKGQTDTIVKFC